VLAAAPAAARDWTPHSAAALLDTTFPDAASCQAALDDARQRESHARPVRGLSYTHLFEQGACRSFHREDTSGWRIRMEWRKRETSPAPHKPTSR
jgi:hypothetical protein